MSNFTAQFLSGIALALAGIPVAQAADYYVSPNGSNSAPGTLSQPFQTIQKAASLMVAGDTAYIRAGVYREAVFAQNSGTQNAPITYMPYNGESVTVSGTDVIPANAWTLHNGNIFKAIATWNLDPNLNQVFVDGQMMIEARWPNTSLDVSHPVVAHSTGGSFIDGGTGLSTGTLTDPNLSGRPDGYWNGAVIQAALGTSWKWQTGSVLSSTSSPAQVSFSFTRDFVTGVPGVESLYYLTGKLGELDTAGEYFLSTPSTLYLWTPAGDSPAQHVVEVKRRQLAFNITNRSFITIRGLNIFGATIWANNASYVLLDQLNVNYGSHHTMLPPGKSVYDLGGTSGILLTGDHNVLRNSTIAFSSGAGITVQGSAHRVFNNTIHDVDYTPDIASPITAGATGAVLAYNTLFNSASEGIGFYAFSGGRVLHNEIYDVGLQVNDIGCTYTYNTNGGGAEIAYNLCHDVHGLLLNNSVPYANGIYLDENSSNYIVHHNVVWNTTFASALNHVSTNNKVYNNTYSATVFSVSAYNPNGPAQLPGTELKNNIFTAPLQATTGAVIQNNILSTTNPQFVDAANHNFQLMPGSPAIGAGAILPPYTDGYSGSAPDIGAYDHAKPAWKAGVQAAGYTVSNSTHQPALTPCTAALVYGTVPFDQGVSVLVTDGAGTDIPARVFYKVPSPPQLAFEVPSQAAPGVAMITITNGDGTISLSSAPIFPALDPATVRCGIQTRRGQIISQ